MRRSPSHNDPPGSNGESPLNNDKPLQCVGEPHGEPKQSNCESQQNNDKLPQNNSGYPLSKRSSKRPISPPSRKDMFEAGPSDLPKAVRHYCEQMLMLKLRMRPGNTVSPINVSPSMRMARSVSPVSPFFVVPSHGKPTLSPRALIQSYKQMAMLRDFRVSAAARVSPISVNHLQPTSRSMNPNPHFPVEPSHINPSPNQSTPTPSHSKFPQSCRKREMSPPSKKDLLEAGPSDLSKAKMHAYIQKLRVKELKTLTAARVRPIGVSPAQHRASSVTPNSPFPDELSSSDDDD